MKKKIIRFPSVPKTCQGMINDEMNDLLKKIDPKDKRRTEIRDTDDDKK